MMTAKQKVIKALHLSGYDHFVYLPSCLMQHYVLTLWKDYLLTEIHK